MILVRFKAICIKLQKTTHQCHSTAVLILLSKAVVCKSININSGEQEKESIIRVRVG